MSMNETTAGGDDLDLDSFSADFFGQKTVVPEEQASSQEAKTDEDSKTDANDEVSLEDTHSEEDDSLADDETEKADDKPKPKKNRFQERIDELTTARREAERDRDALLARLEKLEKEVQTPKPVAKVETSNAPTPDDKNDDGSDKYPLGEFDPRYIRDLSVFTVREEAKAVDAERVQKAREEQFNAQRQVVVEEWNGRLDSAKERYPDLIEKGNVLVDSLSDVEESYGEYLSAAIMSMDYGPDVLYYLSNNLDEARKIVNSGPTKATLALGQIAAKFAFEEEAKNKARPRVSKAPEPPVHLNKGSTAVLAEVPDDTDDLDSFSRKFFKK